MYTAMVTSAAAWSLDSMQLSRHRIVPYIISFYVKPQDGLR